MPTGPRPASSPAGAASTTRRARSTRSTRFGSTAPPAGRCSPGGGCFAVTRGATAASTTRTTRGCSGRRATALSGGRHDPARRSPPADRGAAQPDPRMAARLDRHLVGLGDRRLDRDGPDRARAADDQAGALDAASPAVRPRAEGAPAEVQGRQAAVERGGDEVLPGEQGEPGRLVPPGRLPDPDLHLPLLRPAGLREGGVPALPGLEPRLPERRRAADHGHRQRPLVGLDAARHLCG